MVFMWEQTFYIGHKLCNNGFVENLFDNKPATDLDGNLLDFKLKDNAGGPVYEITRYVDITLKSGFEFNVIADGDIRHSVKIASYTRAYEQGKHRLELVALEIKLTIFLQDRNAREISNGKSIQLQTARK